MDICLHVFPLALILLLSALVGAAADEARPYPPSPVIAGCRWDWSSHRRAAPGSDNWPLTWADDGNQYTAWGDGGGFGGTNSLGRVSLGVARIEGPFATHEGHNVWGGHEPEHPHTFTGKSYGIVCIGGVLYMWVGMFEPIDKEEPFREIRLAVSRDHGATWTLSDWALGQREGVVMPTICQFGRDYAGARDDYVYSYLIRFRSVVGPDSYPDKVSWLVAQKPGTIDLARAPREHMLDRSAYEFFAGLDDHEEPLWTADLAARKPVFEDPNGVGWNVSVSYNAGLGRYLLCTEHTQTHRGKLGIFDAPAPWGPWTTVAYESAWGEGHVPVNTFFWGFSNKWASADGRQFVMTFTGRKENDSWNVLAGEFVLR
jgi:hypothetical protein